MCLKLLLSFCAKCHGSVVKSQLLRHSHTTRHNHCHGSNPQKEKTRFAEKQLLLLEKSEISFSCFFLSEKEPLKGIRYLVKGCLGACTQADLQQMALMLWQEHLYQKGVFKVFVNIRKLSYFKTRMTMN